MGYSSLIDEIILSYKDVLQSNLIGIYFHGSYVIGGFNPMVSDIDFLVVVQDDISDKEKKKLIKTLLDLEDDSPGKGLEMSMMKLCETLKPKKPTSFLLHYSDFYKERYKTDLDYICSGEDDPDLLAHLTVIKARGECKYGRPINEVFGEVSPEYYVDAIMYDLNDAKDGIQSQLDYYVLNICRSLLYFREGTIASKYEGGQWAIKNLSDDFTLIIKNALDKYTGIGEQSEIPSDILSRFIEYSFNEIDGYL